LAPLAERTIGGGGGGVKPVVAAASRKEITSVMNINSLRLNGFFFVLVLTASGCAGVAQSVSLNQPVSSTKFGVRYVIDFPAHPMCWQKEMEISSGKVQRDICAYFDERVGHGFSAQVATFPKVPAATTAEEVLMGAASGGASSADKDIVDERFTKVSSFPALDVTLVPREKGDVSFARFILAGNDLITITADGYDAREKPPAVNAFLESARVLR